jgi:hypothetical protein
MVRGTESGKVRGRKSGMSNYKREGERRKDR